MLIRLNLLRLIDLRSLKLIGSNLPTLIDSSLQTLIDWHSMKRIRWSLQTLTDSKTRKIPKDSYLILNDNRQNTRDSREFGLITSKQIQGVISFRISPLKKFGFIENK